MVLSEREHLSLYLLGHTKRHHQCVTVPHRRCRDCRGMWHLTLLTGADCYTTLRTRTQLRARITDAGSVRAYRYHTSVSHQEPSYTRKRSQSRRLRVGRREECFCLQKAVWETFFFWSLSHGAALVLVIHHRKFWPLCGMSKLYGGGLELSNHTLHSSARDLITYKGNGTFSKSLFYLKMENSEKSYCQE